MVITGLTRNQLYGNVPRVRIPPLPPVSKNPLALQGNFFAYRKGIRLHRYAVWRTLFASIVFHFSVIMTEISLRETVKNDAGSTKQGIVVLIEYFIYITLEVLP